MKKAKFKVGDRVHVIKEDWLVRENLVINYQ